MPRPRLREDRLPLPNSFCVGDHEAYGELYIYFAFTQTKRFQFSEVQPLSCLLCLHTNKTISVQWGTNTIMFTLPTHRQNDFSSVRYNHYHVFLSRSYVYAPKIERRKRRCYPNSNARFKVGELLYSVILCIGLFLRDTHPVVGEGGVSCLVCMYGMRSFVRVAWTRQVLPTACIQDTRLRPHILPNRFARNPDDC